MWLVFLLDDVGKIHITHIGTFFSERENSNIDQWHYQVHFFFEVP